jgi:chromate transporter
MARPAAVGLAGLFLGFLEISLCSYGSALVWARRIVVERRRWLTEREFAELLGLCQALPGGNIVNFSVWLGARFCGGPGAFVALNGLLVVPCLLLIALYVLYTQGAQVEALAGALRGVAAGAAGLVIAAGLKMTVPYRREPIAALFALLAFVGVGLLRWPMLPVLLVLAPCSIALSWRRSR